MGTLDKGSLWDFARYPDHYFYHRGQLVSSLPPPFNGSHNSRSLCISWCGAVISGPLYSESTANPAVYRCNSEAFAR